MAAKWAFCMADGMANMVATSSRRTSWATLVMKNSISQSAPHTKSRMSAYRRSAHSRLQSKSRCVARAGLGISKTRDISVRRRRSAVGRLHSPIVSCDRGRIGCQPSWPTSSDALPQISIPRFRKLQSQSPNNLRPIEILDLGFVSDLVSWDLGFLT